jgi:hypothetical protein
MARSLEATHLMSFSKQIHPVAISSIKALSSFLSLSRPSRNRFRGKITKQSIMDLAIYYALVEDTIFAYPLTATRITAATAI